MGNTSTSPTDLQRSESQPSGLGDSATADSDGSAPALAVAVSSPALTERVASSAAASPFPRLWRRKAGSDTSSGRLPWGGEQQRRQETCSSHDLQLLVGHGDIVRSAARLDGERMVSGSDDGTICVWNWRAGGLIRKIAAHSRAVNCFLWLPALRLLVTGSSDKSIGLWDMDTLAEAAPGARCAAAGGVTCLTEMPSPLPGSGWKQRDSEVAQFCSGGNDGLLRVWRVRRQWNGSTTTATGVQAELAAQIERREDSDDGNLNGLLYVATDIDQQGLLLTASNSRTIMVYDVAALKLQAALHGHRESVLALVALQAGGLFASGSIDGKVILWHARTLTALRSVDNAYDYSTPSAAAGQHQLFPWPVRHIVRLGAAHFAASFGQGFKIFAVDGGELVVEKHDAHDSMIVHLAAVYGDQLLATASVDAAVKLWRVAYAARSLSLVASLLVHTGAVNHILALDASTFCGCSSDGLVSLFKSPRASAVSRNALALAHLMHHSAKDSPPVSLSTIMSV